MRVLDIGNQGIVGPGNICWGDSCADKPVSTYIQHEDTLGLCDDCKKEILSETNIEG